MEGKPLCLEIRNVTSAADLEEVRALLREYNTFLAASTAPGELDLDGRMAELASLPGTNAPPSGALLLARLGGEPAGCVALGPMTLPSGEMVAELRRLWVSPRFRGHALGRALLAEAASCARSAGHRAIYLDCLCGVMPAAMKLYREMGFEPTPRYKNDHSVAETAFLRLQLSPPRPDEASSFSRANGESV